MPLLTDVSRDGRRTDGMDCKSHVCIVSGRRFITIYFIGNGRYRNKHVPTKVTSDAADRRVGDKRLYRDEE